MKSDKLLFGAAYYDEYMPYDRIEKDMEMMVKAGMNTIRIAESTWSTWEPEEGRFDFTHLDRMLDAASRHNISVIVGTPTYAIPSWLAKKSDDILALTHNGQNTYGPRQNMDLTSPIYRKYAERIIRKLMEKTASHPSVIGFQIDNETHPYDTCGPRAQAMFVDYLRNKFPDIEEFNHEFGLDYWSNRVDNWENFPDIRATINGSLAAEYAKFQRSIVTDFHNWQIDIISEYKRPDQFITHNFDFEWHDYSYGMHPEVDQRAASRRMTIAGCDIYHPSQDDLTGKEITACGNIIRSLKNDNYLILETEAQGNQAWLPYPGQLRLQAYSHIGNGANSVMYWHWHSIHNAIESYWKGVLSHDLTENETYREACIIGNEWNSVGDHLKNLKKVNRVAIVADNNSLTGLTAFPTETNGKYSYNTIYRRFADALFDLNIEYDVIPADGACLYDISGDSSLAGSDNIGAGVINGTDQDSTNKAARKRKYDLVIIPALYSADEDFLNTLNEYVENGGNIIVSFKTAFADENLKIYCDTQPHIINKCLGIHYDQFTYPKDVTMTIPRAEYVNPVTTSDHIDATSNSVNTAAMSAGVSHDNTAVSTGSDTMSASVSHGSTAASTGFDNTSAGVSHDNTVVSSGSDTMSAGVSHDITAASTYSGSTAAASDSEHPEKNIDSITGICTEWMELVTCDTAESISNYNHRFWGKYSAATANTYGKGHAMYIATLPEEQIVSGLISGFIRRIGGLTEPAKLPFDVLPHVTVKQGINDYGKHVLFYLNYSPETVTLKNTAGDAAVLIDSTSDIASSSQNDKLSTIRKDENFSIAPWGVVILEY